MPITFAKDNDWKPIKIGAGGWITGIDVAADGAKIIRTDTYGAYKWDGAKWVQLVTSASMPANVYGASGVYEIKFAPSNSSIIYMELDGNVYKSINQGSSWAKTAFQTVVQDANGQNRMDGEKLAVDPINPNIVFAGTQHDGLFVTHDGGASWQAVTGLPRGANAATASDAGLTGILFDRSGGIIAGQTKVLYAATAGSGVYRSADAGVTWTALSGGPSDVSHAAVGPNGTYFATGNTTMDLWKFSASTWTKVIASGDVHSVSIDPFDAMHVIAVRESGNLQESRDGGSTWTGWNWDIHLESSGDIPWLGNSGDYMSSGQIAFDPLVPGKLWQSAGVGVWHAELPTAAAWGAPNVWHAQSVGIEQLVANDIIAPQGANPLLGSWDRAFFDVTNPDVYASSYGGGAFSMGWSLDYASNEPRFIVGISDWYGGIEKSGYSSDGGATWHTFAGLPSWALTTIGGSIAASSSSNIIWAPSGNVAPAFTKDGGATWTNITVPGKADWNGFHFGYYLDRTTVTADRVLPNTFYLYDCMSGVYVSHDGGESWTQGSRGEITPYSGFNAKIEAVPGRAGELFFTGGHQDAGTDTTPAEEPLMHSIDGGATWQVVPGVKEIYSFGYGAPKYAGGPAAIYVAGWVNGDFGIWASIDDAQSWIKIGQNPMGNLNGIKTISGDMDEYGKVYVGFGGSGYAYLKFDSVPVSQLSVHPANDFNGDGRSDVLWTNDAGFVANWLGIANGSFADSGATTANFLSAGWKIAGTGDVNGDGRTDIIWRSASGAMAEWLGQADGSFADSRGAVANQVDLSWKIAGVGDFNGDGRADIVWRQSTGAFSEWLGQATGAFTSNHAVAGSHVDSGWSIAGIGDFNGDGRDDILWRNTGGSVSEWLGQATGAFIGNHAAASNYADPSWSVAGTGDFNGDGRSDILWRNAAGGIAEWLGQPNGGFTGNSSAANGADPNWRIASIGDFNGDGRSDILWRNAAGNVDQWVAQADGSFASNHTAAATTVGLSWHIQSPDILTG